VQDLLRSDDDDLWVSTRSDGLFRFDGESWQQYGERDGLASNAVWAVLQTTDGSIWAATVGGVSRYDGQTWTTHALPEGLKAWDLRHSQDGALWILGPAGSVRYMPNVNPPETKITLSVAQVSQPGNTTLAWTGVDPWGDTPPEAIQYSYRLEGGAWSAYSGRTSDVFLALASGDHLLEVRARDRDFNEDPTPASVRFTVVPPVWRRPWFIGLMVFTALLAGATGMQTARVVRRDRKLKEEAEEELQAAHDLQMGLMPKEPPDLVGASIAGFCSTANSVGGDFYQYFGGEDGLTISLADITGHSVEAAIPAVMFDEVLHTHMEYPRPLPELFQTLNRSLCRSLGQHTFVCLSMVELDPGAETMRLANCGCPYPLHYRAGTGEIAEIQIDAYPLGVRPDTEYRATEAQFGRGDYLVLHSDGFSAATSAEGQFFGFDRTAEVIEQGCSEGLSPESLIDRLIGEVRAFTGDVPQTDDMTCVVIKAEG